jgi:hypothetical protein
MTYSFELRIIEGTAESIRPEMVYMRNTNREKAARWVCRSTSFFPWKNDRVKRDSPVGRAKLSAATRSMVDQGACLNPAILPERFIPQIVKVVPAPFCPAEKRTIGSTSGTQRGFQMCTYDEDMGPDRDVHGL